MERGMRGRDMTMRWREASVVQEHIDFEDVIVFTLKT